MKKGPLFEAQCAAAARIWFPDARRNPQENQVSPVGSRIDILGIPGIWVSCKNEQRMSLAEWIDQVPPNGIVWHKRRGKPDPADAYVTMRGSFFLELAHLAAMGHEMSDADAPGT